MTSLSLVHGKAPVTASFLAVVSLRTLYSPVHGCSAFQCAEESWICAPWILSTTTLQELLNATIHTDKRGSISCSFFFFFFTLFSKAK